MFKSVNGKQKFSVQYIYFYHNDMVCGNVVPNNLLIYLKTSSGFKTQCWYLSLGLLCYKSTMRSIDIPCSLLKILAYSILRYDI